MSDAWRITAESQVLTIPTSEMRQVIFAVTNQGDTPRLADLKIVTGPGVDPSWFTIHALPLVLPGRSAEVAVDVKPVVGGLRFGEQYRFSFHGQVESAVSSDVSVIVERGHRWQVRVSSADLVVGQHGDKIVYSVTNLGTDAATAVLEVPYRNPHELQLVGGPQYDYQLDQSQQHIQGSATGNFTLTIGYPSHGENRVAPLEEEDTVEGRVTTAGEGDVVLCPRVTIHYRYWEGTQPPELGTPNFLEKGLS